MQSLPNFKKEEIATAIDEFILYLKNHHADAGIKNIITNMENIKSFMFGESITLTPAYFANNHLIDKIRGKDFFKYFPEHENMRGYISE